MGAVNLQGIKIRLSRPSAGIAECPHDSTDFILRHGAVFSSIKIGVIIHKGWCQGFFAPGREGYRPFSAHMKQLDGNFCSPIVNSSGQPF